MYEKNFSTKFDGLIFRTALFLFNLDRWTAFESLNVHPLPFFFFFLSLWKFTIFHGKRDSLG